MDFWGQVIPAWLQAIGAIGAAGATFYFYRRLVTIESRRDDHNDFIYKKNQVKKLIRGAIQTHFLPRMIKIVTIYSKQVTMIAHHELVGEEPTLGVPSWDQTAKSLEKNYPDIWPNID